MDREKLVLCDILVNWDLVHSTFGQETVTDSIRYKLMTNYISKKVKHVNSTDLYNKSNKLTNKLLKISQKKV